MKKEDFAGGTSECNNLDEIMEEKNRAMEGPLRQKFISSNKPRWVSQ